MNNGYLTLTCVFFDSLHTEVVCIFQHVMTKYIKLHGHAV